jgi:hypothetical protein
MVLYFNVNNQNINRVNQDGTPCKDTYIADSIDYFSFEFIFSDDWNGYTKTACIKKDKSYNVLLIDDKIAPDLLPVFTQGEWTVSVFGSNGIPLNTANTAKLCFMGSGMRGGKTPEPKSIDVYNQILAEAENAKDIAQSVRVDADNGVFDGEPGEVTQEYIDLANQMKSDATAVANNKISTESSANNAKISETNSRSSEDNAANSATQAANNILNGVSSHNADINSHPSILTSIRDIDAIARGKNYAKKFNTVEEMNTWLSFSGNKATLNIGDNLYIVATNVPDYWWDGTQPQILEANSVNLTDYYTRNEIDGRLPEAMKQSDYDALVNSGLEVAGKIYYAVPDEYWEG